MSTNPSLPSASRAHLDVNNNNVPRVTPPNNRVQSKPNQHHMAENYDDCDSEFSPAIFSALELHLPLNLLDAPRDMKLKFMQDLLRRYSNVEERNRVQKHAEYRKKILSNYMPVYKDLHTVDPSMVFLPSFLNAFKPKNTGNDDCIRSIMTEDAPGVYTFKMLQPNFCHMLLREVDHIENWIRVSRSSIMMPNTVNNFGICLDDFGMKDTLDMFMRCFIKHICVVLFPDVGGTLDSHHGYVVQYGMGKQDASEDFHVDDSEVTLNICLGNEFTGGQLFFESPMCEKHVNSNTHREKIIEVNNSVGCTTLYRGCHRHGARATSSGCRVSLLLWCRSSMFRGVKKFGKRFKDYCEECQTERSAKRQKMVASMTKALGGDASS